MSKYSDVRKIILTKWPKAKIKFIKEFPEGYNNVAYDVKLDCGNYVIKILKLKGFEKLALKQKHIRSIIVKKFKDFPIAKIIKSDYTKKIIDKPYIITEKIDGKSLQGQYDKITDKEKLYEEIGELYGKLHSFKLKNYGGLDSSLNLINEHKSWYLKQCEEVKKLFEKIEEEKLLPPKTLKKNKDFFEKNKFLLKKEIGPRLCHGDAADANIIVIKEIGTCRVSGIIDFEFARASGVTQELFNDLRSFDKKYAHKNSLIKGYTRWSRLPKELEKLIFLYNWMGHLKQLTQIKKMKWRNLSEAKTLERKKGLRKTSLLALTRNMKIIG